MEADAGGRLAVVLDVGWFVVVMGEGQGQFGVLWMRLRIIPANRLAATEDSVAITLDAADLEV